MAVKSAPADMSVPASPPVFNPSQLDQVEFAEYRSNAILREIAQRRQEGRPLHPQHDEMIGEAMAYAYMLLSAKRKTHDDVTKLHNLLMGNE